MDITWTASAEDVALARAIAAGDQRALARAYDLHGTAAYRLACRVLREAALAEDAVQDAFVQLWREAGRYDAHRASLRAWICVLVHRRAVDLARSEARRRLRDEREAPALHADSYSAEEVVLLRLRRREVRRAVDQLAVPQRVLIEHAYYGGLTQSQLAERFGLPLGTVKSRMFEALRAMAVLLRPAAVAANSSDN